MGVPAFFRWLSNKYPKIISPVVENDSPYESANPNGELDNLYLDMNGIVHPCSHPENKPPPENESQMMLEIFKYTDRLIKMARPRKVLMIAIDGVAPRAKMNQQRSRRFKSARDARVKNEEIQVEMSLKRQQDALKGKIIDDSVKEDHVQWDSNAITPGTPFMDILALALRYWVAYKLSLDNDWANLQVVLSDSSVPGEGEHKIMNFIRSQRLDPQYDPNTTHCIYGLDADLIFLGLATHEPHFRILREDVFAKFSSGPNRSLAGRDNVSEEEKQRISKAESQKPFLWLNTHILREYLKIELMSGINIPQLHKNLDFERCLDDWIFLCFFIGNDFLPHLPSLNVRDNSIDLLVTIWKHNLPYLFANKKQFKDYYLTRDGAINMPAVEVLLKSLGSMEDGILRKRHSKEVQQAEFEKRKKHLREQNKNSIYKGAKLNEDKIFVNEAQDINKVMPLYSLDDNQVVNNVAKSNKDIINNPMYIDKSDVVEANKKSHSAAAALKAGLLANSKKRKVEEEEGDTKETKTAKIEPKEEQETKETREEENKEIKLDKIEETQSEAEIEDNYDPGEVEFSLEEDNDDDDDYTIINSQTGQIIDNNDLIRLWEPGYSARYYKLKFNLRDDSQILPFKKKLLHHYLEGISWVLLYYYQGCPSWNWYYPYHYAPFAADFAALDFKKDVNIKFTQGVPFRPFEQLMSVLPADSSHNLPEVFHDLMKNPDSGIIEYYPEQFDIDMNGSKMSWHGIPLLPFINEKKLLKHVQGKYDQLTEAEKNRNENKTELILISSKNKWFNIWKEELFDKNESNTVVFGARNTNISGVVSRSSEYDPNELTEFSLAENRDFDPFPATVANKLYLKVGYDFYSLVAGKSNKSMILNGFIYPKQVLTQEDINAILYGGQGYAVRQKRGFTHSQNEHINFATTIGPPTIVDPVDGKSKKATKVFNPRDGGYLSNVNSFHQQQQHNNGLNSGMAMYDNLLSSISSSHTLHNPPHNNHGYQNHNGYSNNGYDNRGGYSRGGRGGYNGPSRGGYGGPSRGGFNGHRGGYNDGYNNFRGGFQGRGRGRGRGRGGYNSHSYRGGYNY